MYKLFTDKVEIFECDVKLEGASTKNSIARIIVESEDVNLLFNGTITEDGKCKIPIKKLKGLLGENARTWHVRAVCRNPRIDDGATSIRNADERGFFP